MRIFVIPVNSKLILGKDEPKLNIENLKIMHLYNDGKIELPKIPVMSGYAFNKVIIPSYNSVEEFVAYPTFDGEIGAKVRIPQGKDRIIVETTPDLERCAAVEIIEK